MAKLSSAKLSTTPSSLGSAHLQLVLALAIIFMESPRSLWLRVTFKVKLIGLGGKACGSAARSACEKKERGREREREREREGGTKQDSTRLNSKCKAHLQMSTNLWALWMLRLPIQVTMWFMTWRKHDKTTNERSNKKHTNEATCQYQSLPTRFHTSQLPTTSMMTYIPSSWASATSWRSSSNVPKRLSRTVKSSCAYWW